DPLTPALSQHRHLLLSPDGDLTRLPFELLPAGDERLLLDDHHISYVGSGRDVLRFAAPATGQGTDPLVLADPDFDLAMKVVIGSGPGQPEQRARLAARAASWNAAAARARHVSWDAAGHLAWSTSCEAMPSAARQAARSVIWQLGSRPARDASGALTGVII